MTSVKIDEFKFTFAEMTWKIYIYQIKVNESRFTIQISGFLGFHSGCISFQARFPALLRHSLNSLEDVEQREGDVCLMGLVLAKTKHTAWGIGYKRGGAGYVHVYQFGKKRGI